MYGSLTGNIAATAYYLYFQFIGIIFIFLLFRREKPLAKLLLGSVSGSLLYTWLPVLFSFFCGFTKLAHLLALLFTLPIPLVSFRLYRLRRPLSENIRRIFTSLSRHLFFWIVFLLFMIFGYYLLHTHTLLPDENGTVYTGQCTYGDMNMHLGFITSLARQGTFPPDYSIMPGVKLSYPFLSDSVSASLYLLGASLRFAYILPMPFALGQIFTSVYLFADTLLGSRRKSLAHNGNVLQNNSHKINTHRNNVLGDNALEDNTFGGNAFCRKAFGYNAFSGNMLVCLLFFLNGGLGFAYFLDWTKEQTYRFSDIFTGFYTTPTNLVDYNIRWVNVIADMFLPQRATLFGYALLFPMLWLLYRAAFHNRQEYFPLAGLYAAGLPMIHTHSFLSAGVVSAVWLLLWLFRKIYPAQTSQPPADKNTTDSSVRRSRLKLRHPGSQIFAVFLCIMCLLQLLQMQGRITSEILMFMGISLFAGTAVFGATLLARYVKQHGWQEFLICWGIFLACILIFALPQLLFWTFGQVAEGGFVRGYFNWGNQGDLYPWFYLKNIGAPLLLIIGGICACGHKRAPIFLPALFLWWLAEFIVFTPNTYDNNKILYVAYFLLCLGAADYGLELYEKIKDFPESRFLIGLFLFICSFSAILTLGRESVSRYQLYSASQMALAEYVEEHTAPDAVFLTNTRHNNEIAALTGRNIVCGADSFLYFHGLDTSQRKTDLQLMYEAPLEHMDLYEKYHVTYVVISAYERNSYQIQEEIFQNYFTEVLSFGDVNLYQMP